MQLNESDKQTSRKLAAPISIYLKLPFPCQIYQNTHPVSHKGNDICSSGKYLRNPFTEASSVLSRHELSKALLTIRSKNNAVIESRVVWM